MTLSAQQAKNLMALVEQPDVDYSWRYIIARHMLTKLVIPGLFFVAVILSSCTSALSSGQATGDRCIFSVQTIRDSGGARELGSTNVGDGIFFYEGRGGLIRCEHHEGHYENLIGSGPNFTAKIRDAFKRANLPNLDFSEAIAQAAATRRAQQDGPQPAISVTVGARLYRVYADYEGTSFTFECEHLGTDLRDYAKINRELERLQALLDSLEISF
jgi:hypothetical protein